LVLLLPAVLFLAFLPTIVLAETKTLPVTKDTYANKAYPTKVNGGFGSVTISNKFTDRLGFLQFANPDLPQEAIIDQAKLKFYLHELHYADIAKVNIGPVANIWEETSLTWNNKPTINQAQAFEAEISLDSAGWREINLTNLVKKWQDGSLTNQGLFIYPLGFLYGTPETEYAFSFKSKESGDQGAKIEISYHFPPTPTPSLEPTSTPTPTPTPKINPESTVSLSPTPTETPPPETAATAKAEATREAGLILSLTSGQSIILGLIVLALIGALIAFIAYFRKESAAKSKQKAKKTSTPKKQKKEEEID